MPSCPLAAPPRLGGGGTIREAPGFFPAPKLSPRPAPGSSAPAAAFPLPGRGRPRAGAFTPPARGTGVGGAVVLRGIRLGIGGADCQLRREAGKWGACGAQLARRSRGPGRLAREVHAGETNSLHAAWGGALAACFFLRRAPRAGCGKQAAACILPRGRTPGRRSRFSPREKGGGAEGSISFLPVVGCFPRT